MMYDIAAVQQLYGANFGTNSANTTYSWSPTTGQVSINGVGQAAAGGNKIFQTVWDGGGVDTFDFSNYTTNLSIDLRPGQWTTTSAAQLARLHYNGSQSAEGDIANALQYNGDVRSLIENAVGGSGNDVITGNSAANVLEGRAGNDTLSGKGGDDTLLGGAGFDTAVFDFGLRTATSNLTGGYISIATGSETDRSSGIERFQFTDRTVDQVDGAGLVDDLFYYTRYRDILDAGVSLEEHFAASGWREGRDPNQFFDTKGYLTAYPDVAAAGVNALEHYHISGWREGRDPSALFDTKAYLQANPDVAAAGVDPLEHFLVSGFFEGRLAPSDGLLG